MRKFLLAGAALLLCSPSLATDTVVFSGTAYKSKKQSIAYNETHEVTEVSGRIVKSKTTYRNSQGDIIAVLSCDYGKNTYLPDFTFEDLRSGNWEKVVVTGDKVNIQYRDNRQAEIEELTMDIDKKLSGSQGLNQFIVSNLEKAVMGDRPVTTFILPARQTTVDMILIGKKGEDGLAKVELKLQNPFLRLFAPTLELVYDQKSQNLISYYGNSNIYTDTGDKQKVLIEYDYSQASRIAAKRIKNDQIPN